MIAAIRPNAYSGRTALPAMAPWDLYWGIPLPKPPLQHWEILSHPCRGSGTTFSRSLPCVRASLLNRSAYPPDVRPRNAVKLHCPFGRQFHVAVISDEGGIMAWKLA